VKRILKERKSADGEKYLGISTREASIIRAQYEDFILNQTIDIVRV